ncbi:uncharacterized protein BDZ99DRAFT_207967 [Mytilinidion resinicola]|uniref:Uncharacterized protein n=1 Tax=Mytilinidion resinicola TaxID=574789 RepID=A0A6A6Y0Y5_9PEZI|nr:uncharacterized protein BDZ99DRAFT_207967 [Mytilinidion resinicola]KAF2802310.1 hypothetical protein BDZ99DRAFT_207967 [Mytilinidion resinicola]
MRFVYTSFPICIALPFYVSNKRVNMIGGTTLIRAGARLDVGGVAGREKGGDAERIGGW